MREGKHMGPKKMDHIYIYIFLTGILIFPSMAFGFSFIFFSWITDAHMFQRDLKEENGEMS